MNTGRTVIFLMMLLLTAGAVALLLWLIKRNLVEPVKVINAGISDDWDTVWFADALLAGEQEAQVTAKVSGVVEAVYVSAGKDAVAGETLAAIQVGDMGYSLCITVTSEQARKVKAGDIAEVTNNRSGGSISAVLRSIRVDSQDPQNSRILEFDVSGDVTAGAALSVSVAQKSAEYDCVVPNSALRSDANGSFVHTVTTKNSPLGNRYIATRVDVTVLAGDDSRSAVSGALRAGSYVITTSSKPISNGDKVRLGG